MADSEQALSPDADALFFHGDCGGEPCGRTDADTLAYSPNLFDLRQNNSVFECRNFATWGDYSSVGGYSAGRVPAIDYLKQKGAATEYLFILDPSYPHTCGTTTFDVSADIRSWLSGSEMRRLLMIYGPASEKDVEIGTEEESRITMPLVESYVGAIRETTEWERVALVRTHEGHDAMRGHIRAIANPGYRPSFFWPWVKRPDCDGGLCLGNRCTQCILSNRMDIIPFYRRNGWGTGKAERDRIVADWFGIAPTEGARLRHGLCRGACEPWVENCGTPCSQCVLEKRADLVPFYVDNGWTISCGTLDAIVNNWFGIAPSDGHALRANECSNVCPVWAESCGSLCSQCVLVSRPDLVPFYVKSGWTVSCDTADAMVDEWCNRISPNDCAAVKQLACGDVCP